VTAPAGAAGSGPGLWRASAILALKDLCVEWRTLETLSAMGLFALVVLLLFSFAFSLDTIRELGPERLVPGVLWTVFSFSATVGFARSFQHELRNDTLTALALAPVDRGAVFLGKTAANLLKVLTLEALVLPLSAVFFDYDLLAVLGPLGAVVLLHTVGLAEFGTLAAAVAARLGRGEALVATLLFPVCSPLFISAVKCSAAAIGGRALATVGLWLGLTAGFNVLFLLVALMTFDYALED
jgi:heme exporter protein B